jgi:hypothetical protein
MNARTQTNGATAVAECQHHWVLGTPREGVVEATCRKCGKERVYPAALDDLDPKAEQQNGQQSGVATAVGGARPSSVAAPTRKVKPRLPAGKRS